MYFEFNKYGMERPQLMLCELSKKRLGAINDISLSMNLRYTNLSEVRFDVSSVYSDGNRKGEKYRLFDEVRELRLIEIPNFGWYQLRNVNEVSNGHRKIKECIAYSAEVMLQDKQVIDLEGEFRLFDPIRPFESLMGILLLKIPGWKVGNIEPALLTRWRTLSIRKQNLYALLTNDLASAYECLFIFDNQNFTINIVDISREFKATSIFVSHQNLIKHSNVKTMTESIVTALHVRGGNMDIMGVNPSGGDVIYNVDYYKSRMSEGLRTALAAYEAKFANLQPTYANMLTQLRNQNQQLATLRNNPPQYEVTFQATVNETVNIIPALDNASGLNQLEALRRALEGVRAVRIEHGNIPYTDVNVRIAQIDPMITAQRNAIAVLEGQIASTTEQLRNIVAQLRMADNFTDEQWVELNRYFIYDVFQEDSLIWTDIMSQHERQDVQQELFGLGVRTLMRASHPKFEIEIDAVNFLALPEFKHFTEQFELGTTFTLDLDDYIVKPLLLGVDINFEDLNDFRLIYANKHTLDDGFSLIDFNAGNIKASNTISFNLTRIEAMARQHDDVTAFINGALDATVNNIQADNKFNSYQLDENGFRMFQFDSATNRRLPYEMWLTGSQLVFSDTNFQTARLGIGRVQAPGVGGTVYGMICDEIVVLTLKR